MKILKIDFDIYDRELKIKFTEGYEKAVMELCEGLSHEGRIQVINLMVETNKSHIERMIKNKYDLKNKEDLKRGG